MNVIYEKDHKILFFLSIEAGSGKRVSVGENR